MKLLLTVITLTLSLVAKADYYDLARQEAEASTARAAAEQRAAGQRVIQDFNRRITSLVYGFAKAHGGFAGAAPAPEMNTLIPGRIFQYLFATADGYQCVAKPFPWQPDRDDAMLGCIHERTGKHVNQRR